VAVLAMVRRAGWTEERIAAACEVKVRRIQFWCSGTVLPMVAQARRLHLLAERVCGIEPLPPPPPPKPKLPPGRPRTIKIAAPAKVQPVPPEQKAPAAVLHLLSTPAPEPDPPAPAVLLPAASTTPMKLSPPWSRCHWPIGDTKSPDFRWCAEPVIPSRPYCPAHAALAFTKSYHGG
jgi:GcrA cell cycle regulator